MAKKNQYQAEFLSLNNFSNFLFCSFHCTAPTKTKRKTEKKYKNNNRNIIRNAAGRKSCSVGATNLVVDTVVAEKKRSGGRKKGRSLHIVPPNIKSN